MTGSLPSTINLTYGRRSPRLHNIPLAAGRAQEGENLSPASGVLDFRKVAPSELPSALALAGIWPATMRLLN